MAYGKWRISQSWNNLKPHHLLGKSSNALCARAQSILTIESNAGPHLATFSAVMLSPQLHDAEASVAMHAYLEQWDIQTSIDCFTAESTRWIAHQDTSVAELSTHSVAVELSEVLRGSSWKLPPVATNQRHALSGEKSRKGKRKKHPVPAICQSPRRQSARPRKRPKLLTGKEAGPNSDGTTSGLRLREIKGSSYSRNAPTVNVFLRFLYVFECTVVLCPGWNLGSPESSGDIFDSRVWI